MRSLIRALRASARPAICATACLLGACQDLTAKLPAGSVDPSSYATPEAAVQMARNARYEFQVALFTFMIEAGRITDELTFAGNKLLIEGRFDYDIVLDQRHLPDETLVGTRIGKIINETRSYQRLQRMRSVASLARNALVAYAPDSPSVLRAELFAYEAFAEVMLADLYCSGIPLSTVDFEGDWTYRRSSSTLEVYTHAVTLFDSALALAEQDVAVQSLARVGKGRALLALGRYSEAGSAVDGVLTGFTFDMPVVGIVEKTASNTKGDPWADATATNRMTVANQKGEIGLPFRTTRDPRTPFQVSGTDTIPLVRPRLLVANYVEAQLIRAEALLRAGDAGYLEVLNALRTTCTSTVGCATPAPSGTGGVVGLPRLSDPGASPGDTARVSLLFRERAFWLFFTGRRQGDLRRLIRHYDRTVETVYPRGDHPAGIGFFDQHVDVPLPSGEQHNLHYSGCLSRGA